MAPRAWTIDAAVSILADGKPRSAPEIFAEGVKRGLFDPHRQTRKTIYTNLALYIERALGSGIKPLILQDPDRRFRLNRPIDDWPTIDTTGLPPLGAALEPPSAASAAITPSERQATARIMMRSNAPFAQRLSSLASQRRTSVG